jgi:hypothetical protein
LGASAALAAASARADEPQAGLLEPMPLAEIPRR